MKGGDNSHTGTCLQEPVQGRGSEGTIHMLVPASRSQCRGEAAREQEGPQGGGAGGPLVHSVTIGGSAFTEHLLCMGSVLGTWMLLGTPKLLAILRFWGGVFLKKKKKIFFYLSVHSSHINPIK